MAFSGTLLTNILEYRYNMDRFAERNDVKMKNDIHDYSYKKKDLINYICERYFIFNKAGLTENLRKAIDYRSSNIMFDVIEVDDNNNITVVEKDLLTKLKDEKQKNNQSDYDYSYMEFKAIIYNPQLLKFIEKYIISDLGNFAPNKPEEMQAKAKARLDIDKDEAIKYQEILKQIKQSKADINELDEFFNHENSIEPKTETLLSGLSIDEFIAKKSDTNTFDDSDFAAKLKNKIFELKEHAVVDLIYNEFFNPIDEGQIEEDLWQVHVSNYPYVSDEKKFEILELMKKLNEPSHYCKLKNKNTQKKSKV